MKQAMPSRPSSQDRGLAAGGGGGGRPAFLGTRRRVPGVRSLGRSGSVPLVVSASQEQVPRLLQSSTFGSLFCVWAISFTLRNAF